MKGLTNLAVFVIISALAIFFTFGLALIPLGLLVAYMVVEIGRAHV